MQDRSMEVTIGTRIRQIRKTLKLKLEEVANSAQVSKALLSKIENGKVSSPISTYSRIAKALGVTFNDIVGSDGEIRCLIVRKNESADFSKDTSAHGYLFQALGYKWPNKNFSPFLLTYLPGPKENQSPNFTFQGEEFIYVIEGKIEFFHGNERYYLESGDCIFLKGDIPHGGRAFGGKKALALLISLPY